MPTILRVWTQGFVVWVVLFSVAAYFIPEPFATLKRGIVPGLGIIMFGMGMTLTPVDFVRVAKMPRAVLCGVIGQFGLMPLLAYVLAKIFRLEPELAMGFIILGACPGGTASNVIAYLAKADVALSVTMTACSTVLAVFLTPVLVRLYGGEFLDVDALALFKSVLYVVLLPVSGGLLLRGALKKRSESILEFFPAISVLVIVLIIATIVALSRDKIAEMGLILGIIVITHNAIGLALGYGLATAFRLPQAARRTVAIEVGMQNSGLGVALANTHYTAITALPSSIFSVIHNLTGSALATYWQRRRPAEGTESE